MAFERLVALQVDDPASYQRYRDGMTPILRRFGGDFGYDFEVARVLRTPDGAPVNRVFTIHFPDEATSDAFFADPEYLAVREKHFEPAVSSATIVASYERD